MSSVIHQGLWETCRVCNPASESKEKRKWRKPKVTKSATAEIYVRRQVAAELGEDEPTKDEKFALLQKYGVTAPRIDRRVTKPAWKSEVEWKRQLNEFYKATKGLVPQTRTTGSYSTTHSQQAPRSSTPIARPSRYTNPNPWKRDRENRRQDTKGSFRSYGPTRTENSPR
jgi:hypothetical protein